MADLNIADVLPPAEANQYFAAMEQALATGTVQTYEQQLTFGDRIQYEEVRLAPLQDGQVVSLVRDISDRKQAELALQASQQFIQQIADNSPNVIYIYDLAQQRNVYVNREVFTLLGYTAEEIKAQADQSLANFLHPDDFPLAGAHFEQLAQLPDGVIADFEYRVQHRNGEWRWFSSRDTVFARDAEGNISQILGNAQDVTARKQAEAAQRESEEQLQRLAENLPGVVYRYVRYADGRDAFVYLSAHCYEVFGITAEAAIADSSCVWAIVHPDDAATLAEAVAASEANPGQAFYSEHRIITPDGQLKWLRTTASAPYHGAGGEVIWDGFSSDITERQQAELEIRRNSDLREAFFNESTDALFLVDRQTRLITDCNDCAMALFEAESKADLLGIDGNTLQRQPFTAEELTQIRQELIQQGFWSREIEYVTFQGNSLWGNIAAKPITVADTAMNLVRITDITQRKRIETQIRRSEQQLQLTLAFTGIGAWSWHPGTGQYKWTGNMEAMLEIPPGLDNLYEVWRARIHPDDVERVDAT
ncbi:MAG: PAS domain S-box protein, partial [Leptolyngbyaceae cyanobacterium SM2_5_2]|nr:PAS domain S-box protein [Leptolyngbyaceae cyanobacterium SM2_5_2]